MCYNLKRQENLAIIQDLIYIPFAIGAMSFIMTCFVTCDNSFGDYFLSVIFFVINSFSLILYLNCAIRFFEIGEEIRILEKKIGKINE